MLVARRSEINHLDSRSTRRFQQNVFRFHITMDDFVLVKDVQTLQHAVSKLAHQLETESLEVVFLDEFVKVHR